jgi:hypothetical protein
MLLCMGCDEALQVSRQHPSLCWWKQWCVERKQRHDLPVVSLLAQSLRTASQAARRPAGCLDTRMVLRSRPSIASTSPGRLCKRHHQAITTYTVGSVCLYIVRYTARCLHVLTENVALPLATHVAPHAPSSPCLPTLQLHALLLLFSPVM